MYSMIVVDDEKIICDGLKKFISKKSSLFSVVNSFSNATDALEYVKNTPVDLVLTDIKMPDMSGLEFTENLRKFNNDVQIIVLTGFSNFEYVQKAMQNSVFSYLLKPIDNNELLMELSRVADRIYQVKEAQTLKKQNEELLASRRDSFFIKLLFDNFDETEIEEKFQKLYFNADFSTVACNILAFNWEETFSQNSWIYGNDGAKNTVKNYFYTESNQTIYLLWVDQNHLLLIHNEPDIEVSFKGLCELFESLGTQLSFKSIYTCTGILNLANYALYNRNSDVDIHLENAHFSLLNTYIKLNMYDDARLLYRKLLKSYLGLPNEEFINQIKQMFDIISIDGNIDLSELFHAKDLTLACDNYFEQILTYHKRVQLKEYNVIKKMKEYVSKNYSSDITLEEIGAQIYMNPVYLSRYFKQQTGENFSRYLLSVRMVNAIRLLMDGNYKIHEIANLVGYQSARHFAKQFKLFTGYTPKQYLTKFTIYI